MGKKRARKTPDVQVNLEVVDTGIYQELVLVGKEWTMVLPHEVIKLEWQREIDAVVRACSEGGDRLVQAIEVLVSPAAAASLTAALKDNGRKSAVLRGCKLVQDFAASLRHALTDDDSKIAALHGYKLGRAVERLAVLPHEPAALKGKNFTNARKGKSKLTREQQKQCIACYSKWREAGASHHKACQEVAASVSGKFSSKDKPLKVNWQLINRLVKP